MFVQPFPATLDLNVVLCVIRLKASALLHPLTFAARWLQLIAFSFIQIFFLNVGRILKHCVVPAQKTLASRRSVLTEGAAVKI